MASPSGPEDDGRYKSWNDEGKEAICQLGR